LSEALATFQRYVNAALHCFFNIFCTAYINNVLVYSSGSQQNHLAKVKQVFTALEAASLSLDIDKSDFLVKKTKYFRYVIKTGQKVSINPEKVQAIQE
jgi:hypothetical protein